MKSATFGHFGIPLQGSVFKGYIDGKTGYNATAYTFYKAQGLPSRLSKGLVEEFNEYKKKQKEVKFKTDTIAQIAATDNDIDDMDFDLSSLGLDNLNSDTDEDEEIDLDNLDISDIDIDDIDIEDLEK